MRPSQALASIFMLFLTSVNADTEIADCEPAGPGTCQFYAETWFDNGCPGLDDRERQNRGGTWIFDHNCKKLGGIPGNGTRVGSAVGSSLPYTVDIKFAGMDGDAQCPLRYEIAYSHGTYGWGHPDKGAWSLVMEEKGNLNQYRLAFPC